MATDRTTIYLGGALLKRLDKHVLSKMEGLTPEEIVVAARHRRLPNRSSIVQQALDEYLGRHGG